MKSSLMTGLLVLALSHSAFAIELNVDTAKQAAELAGIKVPDALGGSSNTSTMGVAASALGGGSTATALGAAGALTGNSGGTLGAASALTGNSGGALGAASALTGNSGGALGAAATALGVKKEPTPEEKAADALKGLLK
jgi:hypothetical protein